MKTLPPEVLNHIFSLACTDDGSTARALSGVSYTVREETAPFRFRTLALRGAHQICLFLAFLDRLDHPVPEIVPMTWMLKKKKSTNRQLEAPVVCVHHLFIADCAEEREGRPPAWTDWQDHLPAQPGMRGVINRVMKGRSTSTREWGRASAEARSAVERLLARFAPTLQHLCYSKRMSGDSGFTSTLLPALVELTCHCALPMPFLLYSLCGPHRPQDLPALRRLHNVLGKVDQQHARIGRFELPPLLTHFRHSEVENPKYVLWGLSRSAGLPITAWPRALATILIAPKTSAMARCRGTYQTHWTRWDPSAWYEAATAGVDISRCVGLVREDRSYNMQRLFEEWLDRVQGGDGCWVEASGRVHKRTGICEC
jgi:hypothetical protein